MKLKLTILLLLSGIGRSNAQTTISIQNFDGATPNMTYTNTGGTTITGSSVAADRPATATFYVSATTAFSTTNTSSTITFANNTGLASYTSKYFEFRLASWSIGSTGNGADAADYVIADVSLDGGATYSAEVQINGNSNAYWHYSTGTGSATVSYDGNNTTTVFAPTAGGNRTTDGYSTVHIDLPVSCTQAILRIRSLNNATAERWTIDDVKLIGTLSAPCSPGAAPTTNASNFSATTYCTSAQIGFTSGNGANRLAVVSLTDFADLPVNATNYTANSTYGSGSTVGTGNYVVLNGTASNVTISGLTAGTTYYIKVFEYNGTGTNCDESYLTSAVLSYSFTTQSNCSTPQVRSILADACSSQEGIDELVIIENGANALAINDITLGFPSGGTFCNTTCGTNTLLNNAAYITQLNTLAGCSLFTYADPIPAGAIIVVFTGLTPSYVFDYSSQCPSSQQYYAVFCNNTSTAGRFANSGTGTRTLTCDFAGTAEVVSYAPNSLLGDGSFIDFDNAGNQTYRVEPNCVYPLGVILSNWTGAADEHQVHLSWTTLRETEAARFDVYRVDPLTQQESLIESVPAKGTTDKISHYSIFDVAPNNGVNYYYLNQIDRNGVSNKSKLIAIDLQNNQLIANYSNGNINFSSTLSNGDVLTFFSVDGKYLGQELLTEKTNSIAHLLNNGACLLKIAYRNGTYETIRFMVSN